MALDEWVQRSGEAALRGEAVDAPAEKNGSFERLVLRLGLLEAAAKKRAPKAAPPAPPPEGGYFDWSDLDD